VCKAILPLKLLVDADTWQIWGQNLYFRFSAPPPCSKNVPAPLISGGMPGFGFGHGDDQGKLFLSTVHINIQLRYEQRHNESNIIPLQ